MTDKNFISLISGIALILIGLVWICLIIQTSNSFSLIIIFPSIFLGAGTILSLFGGLGLLINL